MTDKLNPKIIKKLDEIEDSKHIKQFIREMLFFELGQLEEEMGRHWTNIYDKAITNFSLKQEKENEENEN